MATLPAATFDDVFENIAQIKGWMTRDQARRLWDRASVLRPDDQVVEIGSYHGRSAIVLGSAAPPGASVIAIDPHAGNDRGPREILGSSEEGQADHEEFMRNLERFGLAERVQHIRKPSQAALDAVEGTLELLYVDGAHRFKPAYDDVARWGARLARGGTMLVHDSFSSIGVTLALVVECFFSGRYRYVGRVQSMAEYRREDLTPAQRIPNALRQLVELPWFVRNLFLKLLIVARLRQVARALGGDQVWPH